MPELGRALIAVGVLMVAAGVLLVMGVRLPFGRLPGDISIGGSNGGLFIPLTSMLILSLLLSVIANIIYRR